MQDTCQHCLSVFHSAFCKANTPPSLAALACPHFPLENCFKLSADNILPLLQLAASLNWVTWFGECLCEVTGYLLSKPPNVTSRYMWKAACGEFRGCFGPRTFLLESSASPDLPNYWGSGLTQPFFFSAPNHTGRSVRASWICDSFPSLPHNWTPS